MMIVDETDDPTISAFPDYERATLLALRALQGHDIAGMMSACENFVRDLLVIRKLSYAERERGLALLLRRELILDHAWDVIGATLKFFRISYVLGDDENGLPTIHCGGIASRPRQTPSVKLGRSNNAARF
jgi:hypothetical protein